MEDYIIIPIAVGVCCITQAIKQFFPSEEMRDKFTPIVALVLGVLFNTWYNKWQFDYIVFLNGLASGLAGIGAFASIKSMFKKNETIVQEKQEG